MKKKIRLYQCSAWFATIDGDFTSIVMARDNAGHWYVIGIRK